MQQMYQVDRNIKTNEGTTEPYKNKQYQNHRIRTVRRKKTTDGFNCILSTTSQI